MLVKSTDESAEKFGRGAAGNAGDNEIPTIYTLGIWPGTVHFRFARAFVPLRCGNGETKNVKRAIPRCFAFPGNYNLYTLDETHDFSC